MDETSINLPDNNSEPVSPGDTESGSNIEHSDSGNPDISGSQESSEASASESPEIEEVVQTFEPETDSHIGDDVENEVIPETENPIQEDTETTPESEIESETDVQTFEQSTENENVSVSGNDVEEIVNQIVEKLQVSENDVSGNDVETSEAQPDYFSQLTNIDEHLKVLNGTVFLIFLCLIFDMLQVKIRHIIGGFTNHG